MAKARERSAGDRDAVKSVLRAKGLRATAARLTVYEHLRRSGKPLSHADVADAVVGGGIDRATVYRNLTDMADKGLVVRADLGDHVWRFSLVDGSAPHGAHPHFSCVDCGTVECLPDVELKVAPKGRAPRAVAKNAEVQIKGRCDDCA
jgi:Fur family transcriptional regulator, ferric uptake regulator